jgi:hypothetical protein
VCCAYLGVNVPRITFIVLRFIISGYSQREYNNNNSNKMSYVTENTIWPTSTTVALETKAIIDLFFTLADLRAPEAGPRMADEVFAEDAEMVSSTGTAKGSAGNLTPSTF